MRLRSCWVLLLVASTICKAEETTKVDLVEEGSGTETVTSSEFSEVKSQNEDEIETLGIEREREVTTIPTPKEEKKKCFTDLTGPSGLFTTEEFPSEYKPSTDCIWNITVPEGHRVQLTFHLLNIEHNEQCIFDWVKVLDSNGTLLKQICGFLSQDLVVKSTSNVISVQFISDGVIESRGFLASWEAIPEIETPKPEGSSDGLQSYTLSFPQSFSSSQDDPPEKICLQLNNVNSDGEVLVSLLSAQSIVSGESSAEIKLPHKSGDSTVHCYNLSLPINYKEAFAVVRVKADFPTLKYKILSYKSVQVLKGHPMVLIQTDKFDYRPKQEVRLRVLVLNSQLKPNPSDVIKSVWIEEPSDSRVAQWKDVPVKKGLAQLSMPLTDEPSLGTWRIKVDLVEGGEVTETTFTVSESVLPKFEVTVEGPEIILRDSQEETFKVCAKYTHGSNVKGKANITFTSSFQDNNFWRAPLQVTSVQKDLENLDQGCLTVKLNNSEIALLSNKTSDLAALIIVTEAATGETHNTTWKGQVTFLPFKLDFVGSSTEHIVGGFPYVGSLKAISHGGGVLPNTKVKLCARLYTNLDDMRNYVIQNSHLFYSYDEEQFFSLSEKLNAIKMSEICSDHQTKADGSLDFSVPLDSASIPANVTKLSFRVVASDYPDNDMTHMQQPFNKLDVVLSRSNLTQALTIHSVEELTLKCSENSAEIFYSANPGDTIDLNYYVTSGASILDNGEVKIKVDEKDLKEEYIGGAEVLRFTPEDGPEAGNKKVLSKYIIKINRPLADEARVSSKVKLLVYIRNTDGRTLSVIKEYKALPCNNTITTAWSAEQLTPASPVKLTVKGLPEAYCGYSVVDKSVDLVANPNKITTPKLSELKEKIAEKRIFSDKVQDTKCQDANLLYKAFERMGLYLLSDALIENTECDTLIDVTHLGGARNEVVDIIPQPVAFSAQSLGAPAPPPPVQASLAFDDPDQAEVAFDLSTQANFAVANRVDERPLHKFQSASHGSGDDIEKPKLELRNFFPETWLFDLLDLDATGEASIELFTPHTITTWVADAVCSDLQTGLSVSNKAELLVTQDFFADILLPYSVKRGEVLPMNVSVFNSVGQKLPMKITVLDSKEYQVEGPEKSVCIDAKDSHIQTFHITAKELNEVNITVEAAISAASVPECGTPGSADGYKDTLQKPIQVKPEGFPVEKVQSEFLCRSADNAQQEENIEMKSLKLPSNLVDGSARAWVSVTGDIMAPALSNLDSMVTLPTGCGEQNMITLVPNIYLVEYLQGTNKSEPKLEDQARKYMKIGYDRQNEHYRHQDGSYSIWGPSKDSENNKGSLWLTTFVVKAFSQASKFINIDERLMQKSIDWILEKQSRKSGCFEPIGQLIHSSIAGPEQSLTASILIALLEVEASNMDVVVDPAYIDTALRCIVENPTNVTDVYTQSLVTYALTLHHEIKEMMEKAGRVKKGFQRRQDEDVSKHDAPVDTLQLSKDHLQGLLSKANSSISGKLFWTTEDGSLSRAVEATAYNTLSLVMQDDLPKALEAIKWMTTNRNSQGGFVSTQDTMVAMQALSKYSIRVSRESNNLDIKSISGTEEHPFQLNEDNRLLLQRSKLESLTPEGENSVSFKVKGQGCFMVQTVLRYNVKESPDTTSFNLTAVQKNEELTLCAQYIGDKKSTDMVVIEAELLSGFSPYENSLEILLNEISDPIVKRYEINEKENKLVLYFDSMAKETNCWKVELKREIKIENLKPAIVKIYDYYNQEDVFSTEYNLISASK